jgi:hypothetical protein
MTEETTIRTDERGVWCDAGPGRTYRIEWTEIYRVSGRKLDLIDSECITIELDFIFGEFIELNSDSSPFAGDRSSLVRTHSELRQARAGRRRVARHSRE